MKFTEGGIVPNSKGSDISPFMAYALMCDSCHKVIRLENPEPMRTGEIIFCKDCSDKLKEYVKA